MGFFTREGKNERREVDEFCCMKIPLIEDTTLAFDLIVQNICNTTMQYRMHVITTEIIIRIHFVYQFIWCMVGSVEIQITHKYHIKIWLEPEQHLLRIWKFRLGSSREKMLRSCGHTATPSISFLKCRRKWFTSVQLADAVIS